MEIGKCPFCGGDTEFIPVRPGSAELSRVIRCNGCGTEYVFALTGREEIVKLFHRRSNGNIQRKT